MLKRKQLIEKVEICILSVSRALKLSVQKLCGRMQPHDIQQLPCVF